MRHGRRGHAGPLGRRPRDRRRATITRELQKAYLDTVRGRERALVAVARARAEHDARARASRHGRRRADQALGARGSTSATRSSCSRCCARGGSRSGRPGRASRRCSPRPSARRTARRSRRARPGLHLCMRLAGVGPGDEVITSPYSFVASANCAIYEGATPVFADIDPHTLQPRPGGGRGGDHAAHEGDRRRRHLRLSVRARRAARDLRAARPRARRGRVRGARRALQGAAARLARPPGDVGVLPEQADDDRRGRRGHDRLGRGARAARARCATRAGSRRRAGSSTAGSASTTGSTTSRRRSGSASSRSSTASSTRAAEVAARYAELLAGARRRAAAPRRRRPRPLVVRLRRQAAARRRPRRRHGAARRRGHRVGAATCRRSTSSRTCASGTASPRALLPGERGLQRADDGDPVPRAARARGSGARRRGLARGARSRGIIGPWRTAPPDDLPRLRQVRPRRQDLRARAARRRERGHGARTRVWVEGIAEPIVASRTERAIVAAMGVNPAAESAKIVDEALDLAHGSPRPPSRAASTSSISAAARAGCSSRPRSRSRRASSERRPPRNAAVSVQATERK